MNNQPTMPAVRKPLNEITPRETLTGSSFASAETDLETPTDPWQKMNADLIHGILRTFGGRLDALVAVN
jgi:hypothetical protein